MDPGGEISANCVVDVQVVVTEEPVTHHFRDES